MPNSQKARSKNPNYLPLKRKREWLRKYGITLEQFNEMLDRQGGRCAICRKKCEVAGVLGVDHCHSSGVVRGLLCRKCNTGIAMFGDDPKLLARAIRYLMEV